MVNDDDLRLRSPRSGSSTVIHGTTVLGRASSTAFLDNDPGRDYTVWQRMGEVTGSGGPSAGNASCAIGDYGMSVMGC